MTERSRESAVAAVAKFTAGFANDEGFTLIPTAELRQELGASRAEGSRRVILVDCREQEEQRTSMIPGAITKDAFESEVLPGLMDQRGSEEPLVVPYCTIGYRSGMYCRELVQQRGLKNVRNGEGIIMWTFDGDGLVKPCPGEVPSRAPPLPGAVPDEKPVEEQEQLTATLAREVHVYGKPWDMAAEGYQTRFFSTTEGAARYIQSQLRGGKVQGLLARVTPWMWVFALLYFCFTPTCGIMYDCGCQFAGSKWSQFKTCNVSDPTETIKCPWCSCKGISCIFVASDMVAFKDVPLLDSFPDGTFLTVFTVLAMFPTFKAVDKLTSKKCAASVAVPMAAKVLLSVLWFVFYCLLMGAIFFAIKSDYPYFLGFERAVDDPAPSLESAATAAPAPAGSAGGSGRLL